jgi:hypothetical protein
MKIAQVSDTHIGITTIGQLRAMFRKLQQEEFDVLVHCGDYGGTGHGAPCVLRTVDLMRKHFPDKPIVSTIGNHDYWRAAKASLDGVRWHKVRPDPVQYQENLDHIRATFSKYNVHFIDKDGLYKHPSFDNIILIGSSGWYGNPHPGTNDKNFLPLGMDGDTNRTILRATEKDLFDAEEELSKVYKDGYHTVVFVSHFPVINAGRDYKGAFEDFSWRESVGDYFQENYKCKYFLCGHAHQLHKGPLRWECGPDYYNPKYQIISI